MGPEAPTAAWPRMENGSCSLGPGDAAALRQFAGAAPALPAGRYAAHICSEANAHEPGLRACMFRNICYRGSDRAWVMFMPRVSCDHDECVSDVAVVDNGGTCPLFAFPEPFVSLGITPHPLEPIRYTTRTLTPDIEQGPVPDGATWINRTAVFAWPHGDDNFGHFIFETAFAMFELAELFAEYEHRGGPLPVLFGTAKRTERSYEFGREFIKPLFGHVGVPWEDIRPADGMLCFNRALVGLGPFGIRTQTTSRQTALARFRRLIVSTAAMSEPTTAAEHACSILVLLKREGRRLPIFPDDTGATLRAALPDCEVTVADPTKWSVGYQIEAAARTTVLISPCGGISFLAPFMPRFAAFINICGFSVETQCAFSVEDYLWHWNPALITMHYPIEPATDFDLREPPVMIDDHRAARHAHAALQACEAHPYLPVYALQHLCVHVDASRLVAMVRAARERQAALQ
jgi:hypothetical protein